MIYFTSDLHFFHANIIKHCDRPFQNINEMNQVLIDNWNKIISPKDEIYILGDLIFENKCSNIESFLYNLNGYKYLIVGNHDQKWAYKYNGVHLRWIKDIANFKYQKRRFVLCHYPMISWKGSCHGSILLHGHIHNTPLQNLKYYPDNAYNVGVDVNNFKPVSIEKIIEKLEIK